MTSRAISDSLNIVQLTLETLIGGPEDLRVIHEILVPVILLQELAGDPAFLQILGMELTLDIK